MIVAPYTYISSQTAKGIWIHRIQLLCQGGRTPWTEDEQPIEHVLEPNGLYASHVIRTTLPTGEPCILAQIDLPKTAISSMYTWNEIPYEDEDTLCWRSFTIGTTADKQMWLPPPNGPCAQIISNILKTECV